MKRPLSLPRLLLPHLSLLPDQRGRRRRRRRREGSPLLLLLLPLLREGLRRRDKFDVVVVFVAVSVVVAGCCFVLFVDLDVLEEHDPRLLLLLAPRLIPPSPR